jgi:hypothetical protein
MQCGHRQETHVSVPSVSWPRRPAYLQLRWRALAAVLGGLILRLWMMSAFPQVGGDALIYGNLAKNILQHGQFALTDGSGVVHSTLIRLPGYPLFLAACFRLFGIDNYRAVAWLQIILELAACLLLADFVRRISTPRAGLNTLWLATMCPFTAVYASAPLTESLTFGTICLALWSLNLYLYRSDRNSNTIDHQADCSPDPELGENLDLLNQPTAGQHNTDSGAFAEGSAGGSRGLQAPEKFAEKERGFGPGGIAALALFTLAISAAALLRPDGALLAIALWPVLIFSGHRRTSHSTLTRAFAVALLSILPFAAWTARNWHTFHVFEPLAPRYATDPGEDPHLGWQHWVKTWCVDFSCTSEIYWNVPDGTIAMDDLPSQAFDSPGQKQKTGELFSDYNRDQQITPEIDARFEALAHERTATHPLRTWIWMPLGRLADMTLRPRVENLTIDLRWWEYWNHRAETRFSVVYAVVNLLFLMLGFVGFFYRPRLWPYMAAYLILRSLLLLTIEAPETRYTLEFFPVIFALGGIALQRIFTRTGRASVSN